MTSGRVDVLAYDEHVPLEDGELTHERAISIAAWVVVAVVLGYGFLEGTLLVPMLAATTILGVRALLFREGRVERTRYRAVDAGHGMEIVRAHEQEARKRSQLRIAFLGVVVGVVLVYAFLQGSLLWGVLTASLVGGVGYAVARPGDDDRVPRLVEEAIDREQAKDLFELTDDEL